MKKKLLTCILCLLITAFAMFAGCSSPSSGNTQDSPDLAADQTSSAGSQDGNRSEDTPDQGDSSSGDAGESETEEVPVEAPDFEVTLVSGETVKLSDYRGQKVLLNFWATWCGPCVKEMPAFQRLYEEYPDDVVILAVNCGDTADEVREFAEENGYTFNIAIDEALTASSLYPTTSIPLTIIVDEEGYISYGSYGAYGADTMYEHYKEILGLN